MMKPVGQDRSFWELLIDPKVSSRQFRKIYDEYHEYKEEVEKLLGRGIPRREFLRLAGLVASCFGVASLAGSARLRGAYAAQLVSPTSKPIKKGLMRIGYIATLDCSLLAFVMEKKRILEEMGWETKYLGAAAGPLVMEAYIANEIDFAVVGAQTPGLALQRGVPLKLLVGGMVGHGGIAVRNELWNQGVKSLPSYFEYARKRRDEGRKLKVSTQVPGTGTYMGCLVTIMDNGMKPEDFDIKMLPPPEVSSTIITGEVDANDICEQYDTFPEFFRVGRVIAHRMDRGPHRAEYDGREDTAYTQCTAVAVRPNLEREKKLAFVEASRQAAEFIDKNVAEAILIAAQVSGTAPAAEYVAMFRRARWHHGINYASVDGQWNKSMTRIGLAKKKISVDEMIDTELAIELRAPFTPIAGVKEPGQVDVTSEEFRRDAWAKAQGATKVIKY